MKIFQLIVTLLFWSSLLQAQTRDIDSLKNTLEYTTNPRVQVDLLNELIFNLSIISLHPYTKDYTPVMQQYYDLATSILKNTDYPKGKQITTLSEHIIALNQAANSKIDKNIVTLVKNYSSQLDIVKDKKFKGLEYWVNTIVAYFYFNDFKKMRENGANMFKIFNSLNNKHGICFGMNAQATFYFFTGNLQKAEKLYLKSLKIAEKNEDKNILAVLCYLVSNLKRRQGDYLKSLEYGLKAKEYVKGFNNILHGHTLERVSRIYWDLGENQLASENVKLAIQIDSTYDVSYYTLGKIYFSQNDSLKALQNFRISKNKSTLIWTKKICEFYIDVLSAQKSPETLVELLKKNIEEYKKTDNLKDIPELLLVIAEIQLIHRDFIGCEETSREALNIALTHKDLRSEMEAYKLLSKTYEKFKRFDQSLLYNRKYYQLKEKIAGFQKLAEMEAMEFENRLDIQQVENRLLKRKNDQQSSQLRQRTVILYIGFVGLLLLIALVYFFWRNNQIKRKRTNNSSTKIMKLLSRKSNLKKPWKNSKLPKPNSSNRRKWLLWGNSPLVLRTKSTIPLILLLLILIPFRRT